MSVHDGMQYDPIQGQGHEPLKVGSPFIFIRYLLRHSQRKLATDQCNWPTAVTTQSTDRTVHAGPITALLSCSLL